MNKSSPKKIDPITWAEQKTGLNLQDLQYNQILTSNSLTLLRYFVMMVVSEFVVLCFIYLFRSMPNVQKAFVWQELLKDVILTSPFLALTLYINYRLIKWGNISFPDKKKWKSRTGAISAIAVVTALVIILLVNIPFYLFDHNSIKQLFTNASFSISTLILLLFNVFSVLGMDAVLQYQTHHQQQLEIANLKKENITYHYQRLKDQINPHFLFNNLNVLVSLIHIDSDRAELFTKKLAKVYRYVLAHDDMDLVELSDEMLFIASYIDLLTERFDEGLEIRIAIEPSDLSKKIIPLSLQGLVENAIKHNIISSQSPLLINIQSDGKYLIVKNNLQKRLQASENSGFGLKGMNERYGMLSGRTLTIQQTDSEFIVQIPLM